VDIEFLVKPNKPTSHAQYVFEVKYLKKEAENLLAITQATAEKQLRNYLATDEILQGLTKLKALAVVVIN
jgi:ribosomal protein S4